MNETTRALNPDLALFASRGANAQAAANSILDAHEGNMRSNRSNDGRSFQKEIERTCGAYHSRRVAVLRKCDPPTRLVGSGAQRRVLFMANPFLDFVGTWTTHHGRALFIECKSTGTHRLPFARSGGITAEQVSTIKTWRLAGAAAAILWRFNDGVVLITPEDLLEAERTGAKSLTYASGRYVPRGEGNVLWDFLPVLEVAIWGARS